MGKRKSGTKSGKSVSKALKESPKRDDDEGTQTLAPSVSESSLSAPSPEPVEDDQSEDSVTGDSDEEDDQQVMDRDRCSIESTVLHTESIAVHAEIKKMKIEDIKCHQMDLVFQAGMYIQSKAMHKKEELELMIEKDYTNRVNKVSGKDIPVPLRRYGRSGELLYRERLLLSGTTKVKGRSLWREFEATKKQLRIHAGYSAEFTNAGTSGKTKQDRWNHLLRRHYQKVNLGDDKGFDPSTYRIKKYHTVFRKYGVIVSKIISTFIYFFIDVVIVVIVVIVNIVFRHKRHRSSQSGRTNTTNQMSHLTHLPQLQRVSRERSSESRNSKPFETCD